MEALTWKKSSYSGPNGGGCVEVAQTPEQIFIRDSKNPGPTLRVGREDWQGFVEGLVRRLP